MMEEIRDDVLTPIKDSKPYQPMSKRMQVVVGLTTYLIILGIFSLIRDSAVWNHLPRISIQFPSPSKGQSNRIAGVHYPNTGLNRPCLAPHTNLWSGLSESDVEIVLETIELKKADVGIKQDAKM
jgi:hypothetical protein